MPINWKDKSDKWDPKLPNQLFILLSVEAVLKEGSVESNDINEKKYANEKTKRTSPKHLVKIRKII